jgi:hypothetical protein
MTSAARLACLVALVLLAGPARAEFLFKGPPQELDQRPACSGEYRKTLELSIATMEKLRQAGPKLVGQVCTLIEGGSDMVGGELSDGTRQRIKGLLGIDVDLRLIKTQCRQNQGNLDRTLMTELGYLKSEQLRCGSDTI